MTTLRNVAIAAVSIALLQACATPQTVQSDGVGLERPEASIPFANQRSAVSSWQADGQEGLWIQDGRKDWYYAKLFAPCIGLNHAIRLGFDTGTTDKLDRFSHVVVPEENQRCAIMSFTKSDPPPDGRRRSLAGEEVK